MEPRDTHERTQARLNAEASVRADEDDAQAAATVAVAWALLDIASAIRELADVVDGQE